MQYVIPFVVDEGYRLDGRERSRYTAARLRTLAKFATRLRQAGWGVWFTLSGLGIEPPAYMQPDGGATEDEYIECEEHIEEVLVEMGIEEAFDLLTYNLDFQADPPDGWLGWPRGER